MTPVNWKGILLFSVVGVLFILLAVLLMSAGCTTLKGLRPHLRASATVPVPVPTTVPVPTPSVTISQPVVYAEPGQWDDEYMYRTSGRYLGENFGWRRDDVVYTRDMIVNVTVYDYKFLPSYQWWSTSWGRYFPTWAPEGKKYLFVFVRMTVEGTDRNHEVQVYGFPSKYYGCQYKGVLWPEDTDHEKGIRILEMGTMSRQTIHGTEPLDYGWARTYQGYNISAVQQTFVREGKDGAFDGYIIYVVPKGARAEDIVITADFQSLGGVAYWKLTNRN